MMRQSTKVTHEALALSYNERGKLASRLLRSLDEPNEEELSPEELEKLWIEEAERRSKACEEDRSLLIPLAEVKRRVAQMMRK